MQKVGELESMKKMREVILSDPHLRDYIQNDLDKLEDEFRLRLEYLGEWRDNWWSLARA